MCKQSPLTTADMCAVPYAAAVRLLMYMAIVLWPYIPFAMSILTQFISVPGCVHWEGPKRAICYLGGTRDYRLTFGGTHNGLVYTGADWALQKHRHLILGYTFLINGGTIAWSSKKQPIVALSTMEAK